MSNELNNTGGMEMNNRLTRAEAILNVAFKGKPEAIAHSKDVAARLGKAYPAEIEAALLHDVLEDSALTAQDLLGLGVEKEVVRAVSFLTRDKGESYAQYIQAIRKAPVDVRPIVLRVKTADLKANLARPTAKGDLKTRYEKALKALQAPLTLADYA